MWMREPLLHFLVLGALVFSAYGWLNSDVEAPQEIRVTSGIRDHLASVFRRSWMRAPTDQEMADLVEDWVRTEIASREALSMGLDGDDTVVRLTPSAAVFLVTASAEWQEIVHYRQGREGITRRRPWLAALVFGLLHGFGFAGALSETGLPEHAIPVALLFFNLGVEVGQLCFIAAMLVAWRVVGQLPWPEWAWRLPVYAIGTTAAFWSIARISAF